MKFYSEIIALAARFFNLSKDATESEVHQALTEAKTFEEMKAEAIADAGATLEKVNEITGSLEALKTQMEEMRADNEGKSEKITALDSRVNDLTTALTEKEKTIEAQKAEIENLSSSLATYKVKSSSSDDEKSPVPADRSIPVESPAKSANKQVVSNAQFSEMFN